MGTVVGSSTKKREGGERGRREITPKRVAKKDRERVGRVAKSMAAWRGTKAKENK